MIAHEQSQPLEVTQTHDLQIILDQLEATRRPRALKRGGRTVAVIVPAPHVRYANRRPRRPGRRGLGPGDTFWDLVGMIKDEDGPTDVSSNKHRYLADAYENKHKQ